MKSMCHLKTIKQNKLELQYCEGKLFWLPDANDHRRFFQNSGLTHGYHSREQKDFPEDICPATACLTTKQNHSSLLSMAEFIIAKNFV